MKIQVKSSLILFFTLIIGVIFGVLIDRTYMHRSFEQRIERMRGPGGFMNIFERIIEPDERQRKIIEKVFEKYSDQMMELNFQ